MDPWAPTHSDRQTDTSVDTMSTHCPAIYYKGRQSHKPSSWGPPAAGRCFRTPPPMAGPGLRAETKNTKAGAGNRYSARAATVGTCSKHKRGEWQRHSSQLEGASKGSQIWDDPNNKINNGIDGSNPEKNKYPRAHSDINQWVSKYRREKKQLFLRELQLINIGGMRETESQQSAPSRFNTVTGKNQQWMWNP